MTTAPFKTTPADYLKCLLALWLPRHGWWIIVPMLTFAGIGIATADVRFAILALFILFIVAPMVMSMLYIYYMLTPEARRAILPKQVDINEGKSIGLTYLPANEDDTRPLPPPETIDWDNIKTITRLGAFRVYILKTPRLSFIIIPYEAISADTRRQSS